jgi:phosphoglycerate dehydrogenase-like enzyme
VISQCGFLKKIKEIILPNIAILDDYTDAALSSADWGLLPEGYNITVFNDHLSEPAALIERLKGFDVICAMRERAPFPAQVFESLPKLKLFITTGMRNASVDISAANKNGIIVCGTSGSGVSTPEHTWALLQACARNIPHDAVMMREGKWQTKIGVELFGRTLGLLGLGRIGGRVAEYAKVFGMNIVAWSPNLTQDRCNEFGAKLVSKEELFGQADFLSIHLVLGSRSHQLVSENELKLMKSSSFLINTSRGPIVDEKALIAALKRRKIRGAGIDVYNTEPLPVDNEYRKLDNIILTPHTGYFTEESYKIFYQQIVENIIAWHNGSPLRQLT